MTRAPSGFTPGLRTHADRTRARTPGQGQAQSTSPELHHRHLPHASPPTCEFTRTYATFVSHHHQVVIHQQGWTLVLNPDGTTTAWNKDKTKELHSHGPPARPG